MSGEIKGKVALITGSARGIGRSIALRMARGGAKVVLSDIDESALKTAAGEFSKEGFDSASEVCDISDATQVKEMIAKIEKEYSSLDILVNNAGITKDALLVRSKEEDWDTVLAVNLKGTMNCTKSAARGMMKRQWGRIVNIASVVGQIGNTGQAIYSATKAGIIGFTKTMARELASRNITVNAVAPGFIQTDMTDNLPSDVREMFMKQIPLGKLGQPEDVANAVFFLSTEESSYITGQIIGVNGGMSMI